MGKKKLILKSSPRSVEVTLVGGVYDGNVVKINPSLETIKYGEAVYIKVLIEDEHEHKVFFYRSVTLTDIQAISLAIKAYKED